MEIQNDDNESSSTSSPECQLICESGGFSVSTNSTVTTQVSDVGHPIEAHSETTHCSDTQSLEDTAGTSDRGELKEVSLDLVTDDSVSEASSDMPITSTPLHSIYNIGVDNVPYKWMGCSSEFKGDNFTKGCKWSPDGSCILTNSNDNCLRIFNLPFEFCDVDGGNADWNNMPEMVPVLKMQESDTVYDYCWFPSMSSTDPISCCFVASSRGCPIHLWDAYTGQLRCSYQIYNHMDDLVSAICLAFSIKGDKLYCGFDKVIRIFDVSRPGRLFEENNTKDKGQHGIISCIAMNPADDKIYAAGSYHKIIAIYAEPEGKQQFRLQGQVGGVTHLMFSPDGNELYSGGRMDPEILCWDLRNPGEILSVFQRTVSTHQRIYFDIDRSGRYVISGNSNGLVTVWENSTKVPCSIDDDVVLSPPLILQAHDDCVNGISFNSMYPIIASSSGQRKFPELIDDDSDSDEIFSPVIHEEKSLQLWWAGQQN